MSVPARRDHLIYLYAPISAASEYRPLHRSKLGRAKAAMLRARDRAGWRLLGSHAFDFDAWRRTEYTNKGDIAIRLAIRQLLDAAFGGQRQFVELDWGALDEAALADINATADLFVICGGGYVSADRLTGEFSRRMEDVSMLARVKCPVVAFGIGYNSIFNGTRGEAVDLSPQAVGQLRALADALTRISVRARYLDRLLSGVSSKSISLIGDPALFLRQAAATFPAAARQKTLRVGLNFALHGPLSASIFQFRFPDYVQFLRRIRDAQPVNFFYFKHFETEDIAVALLRRHGIDVEIVDLPPQQMLAVYGQMDCAITQMLHSSILAVNAGVPVMNVAYDQKNLSFFELMGLAQLCIDHETLTQDRLWHAFTMMLDRRAEIVAQLAHQKAHFGETTRHFADEVAALLAEGPRAHRGVAHDGAMD